MTNLDILIHMLCVVQIHYGWTGHLLLIVLIADFNAFLIHCACCPALPSCKREFIWCQLCLFFGFLSLFFSSANGANALRLNSHLLLCTNRRFYCLVIHCTYFPALPSLWTWDHLFYVLCIAFLLSCLCHFNLWLPTRLWH